MPEDFPDQNRPQAARKRPPARRAARPSGPDNYAPPAALRSSPLAAVLVSTIGGMESAAQIRESLALVHWPEVVGPQGAAASQPESVRDGILFVRTRSSVWSHELTLHKPRLLAGLNRLLGGPVVKEIVFRARGMKPPVEVTRVEQPDATGIQAVVLSQSERVELREKLHALYSVEDDRAREVLARRLTQEAKLRRWRLDNGWRTCRRCEALHETEFALCPICRLCG